MGAPAFEPRRRPGGWRPEEMRDSRTPEQIVDDWGRMLARVVVIVVVVIAVVWLIVAS